MGLLTTQVYKERISICIPIPHRNMGGMYTFLANWKNWLNLQGIRYTEELHDDYNVLFVNSWAVPYAKVLQLKKQRPELVMVQRVDGSARDYGRWNDNADERQAQVNMLADLTIFQSSYSKYSTREKFRVIRQDGPVIYNPVDTKLFRPDGHLLNNRGWPRVCNASFSLNRKKGTWQLGTLAQQNPKVDFILCGNYPELPKLPNIHMQGHLKREELAKIMRSCDVFLHLAENDPCPNVITEALASGLPVLYKNSGGSPELVGECGLPVTPDNFSSQLNVALTRKKQLSKLARKRAIDHFSLDHIFSQYIDAITHAERKPLPSLANYIWTALWGYPVLSYPFSHLPRHIAKRLIGKTALLRRNKQ